MFEGNCVVEQQNVRRRATPNINFEPEDLTRVKTPHDDPLVVTKIP